MVFLVIHLEETTAKKCHGGITTIRKKENRTRNKCRIRNKRGYNEGQDKGKYSKRVCSYDGAKLEPSSFLFFIMLINLEKFG